MEGNCRQSPGHRMRGELEARRPYHRFGLGLPVRAKDWSAICLSLEIARSGRFRGRPSREHKYWSILARLSAVRWRQDRPRASPIHRSTRHRGAVARGRSSHHVDQDQQTSSGKTDGWSKILISPKSGNTYVAWIHRYTFFHGSVMGAAEVTRLLTSLIAPSPLPQLKRLVVLKPRTQAKLI